MSDELIPISLWIAGRSYRIRINPEEEAAIKKAVKVADDKIAEMRTHYAGKDDQDFIAMCFLMYALDSVTNAMNDPVIIDEIEGLCNKIDNIITD